jgi:hypothetical protein
MKGQAPVGQGLGTQKFRINPAPGGGLLFDGNAQTPLQAAVAPEPIETPPETPTPAPPVTAFSRLYPGVDPSKVEMALDEKSGKIRFRPIQAPADTAPAPPEAWEAPAPVAPFEPDAIAQLRAEIAQQNQLQSAMLTALMTGRPLMEVLSGAPAKPAEPDYSRFDLEEEEGRAAYAQAVRADAIASAIAAAKAEMQAEMRNHLPSIQNANKHGEHFALQAKYGAEPDFQQKSALAMKLAGNNPNVSIEATYNLISQIQAGLGVSPAPTPSIKQPSNPILTPAQQAEKAAQAARYQSTNGGRATGPPEPPPEVAKNFKKLAHWVAQQQALGNLQ